MKMSPLLEEPKFVTRGEEMIAQFQDLFPPVPPDSSADSLIRGILKDEGIKLAEIPLLDRDRNADIGHRILTRFATSEEEREVAAAAMKAAKEAILGLLKTYHNHPIAVESLVPGYVYRNSTFGVSGRPYAEGYLSNIFSGNSVAIKSRPTLIESLKDHKFIAHVIGPEHTPAIRLAIGDPPA